jgi:hypothetical protein
MKRFKIYPLSKTQKKEAAHDPTTKVLRITNGKTVLDFEVTDKTNYVLNIETAPEFRNQKSATGAIYKLWGQAKASGKKIDWGTFTEIGEKYLQPTIQRITQRA